LRKHVDRLKCRELSSTDDRRRFITLIVDFVYNTLGETAAIADRPVIKVISSRWGAQASNEGIWYFKGCSFS